MEWLKSLWTNSKVRVALIGGALVVATAYGTCTLDPEVVSDGSTATTEAATGTVEVSTTTGTEATTATSAETTTSTETTAE